MRYFISVLCAILVLSCLSETSNAQTVNDRYDLAGKWQGELALPNMKLTLVIKIQKNSTGNYSALIDVPQQGAKDISVDKVIFDGNKIELKVPSH